MKVYAALWQDPSSEKQEILNIYASLADLNFMVVNTCRLPKETIIKVFEYDLYSHSYRCIESGDLGMFRTLHKGQPAPKEDKKDKTLVEIDAYENRFRLALSEPCVKLLHFLQDKDVLWDEVKINYNPEEEVHEF